MGSDSTVQVKRAYDPPAATDGRRVLVDRLWPRGLSKAKAHFDDWLKQVAPSTELRRWYAHDPAKFAEFSTRYLAELSDPEHADALAQLRGWASEGGLTLLTASKRADISEATVLADLLNP